MGHRERTAGVLLILLTACGETTPDPSSERAAVCTGCLCLDPQWSCDDGTWIAEDGAVVELGPEAGFFELGARCYVYEGQERCIEPARSWYAFQPAAAAPETKPLAVFFNGAAVHAESSKLYAHNTSNQTLDPKVTGEAAWAPNPHSWTSFANVLYLDPRHSGFSYALGGALAPSELPSLELVIELELADVMRVLVRFLGRHLDLQDNPVIIVAESFAGTRANWLLDTLYHYDRLVDPTSRYVDEALHTELQTHFRAIFPESPAGHTFSPDEIARQFGTQVLIQPLVAGQIQLQTQDAMQAVDPWPDCDVNPEGCEAVQATYGCADIESVIERLVDPDVLSAMTEVDVTTIEWLHARSRTDAVRVSDGACTDWNAASFTQTFGALKEKDSPFVDRAVPFNYTDGSYHWAPESGYRFLSNARYARTFITNALLDEVIWSAAIPVALQTFGDAVAVTYDSDPRQGVARPGWIQLTYHPDWIVGETTVREIRFPSYANSGHMVPAWEPAAILEDVRTWYEGGHR